MTTRICLCILSLLLCFTLVTNQGVARTPISIKQGEHLRGGTRQIGITDVRSCLSSCTESCIAIDFNFEADSCWFHTTDSICNPSRKKASCAHYQFVTCSDGYHAYGAIQVPGVFDAAGCVSTCTGDCTAADFDRRVNGCWLHSTQSGCNELIVKGSCVHYSRINCDGSENTQIALPTLAPSNNGLATYDNMHAAGGSFHSLRSSSEACTAVCLGIIACIAVDYTSSTQCWVHGITTACGALRSKDSCVHIRLRSCTEEETTSTVECGVSSVPPSFNARIIGGSEAIAHSWPWQARVVAAGVECGGSLIDAQFIVTAAHCLATNTDPNAWTVIMGDHDRRLVEEEQESVDVVATIIHSGYNPSTNANDIALLKLKNPVAYTNAISPLCLPEVGDSFADGTECVVTGWGLTSSRATSLSQVLNQVRIPIVQQERCIEYHGDIILPSMICAGLEEGGRDACQGDSGGPLACKSKGRYVLTGLTSFGRGCAQPESPGVYTRLSSFTAWIADNAIA